jgi:hypothetical protein
MNGTDARPGALTRHGAARLLFALFGAELLLVALHGTVRALDRVVAWGPLNTLLDLDREQSLGTWFSAAQLLAIAVIFAVAARGGPPAALSRALWLMAAGFAFLAADEGLQIHETLTARGADVPWLQAVAFRGGHGTWIAVYAAVGLALLALTLPALREVWRGYRAEAAFVALGVAVMGAGAVGMEAVSYVLLRDGSRAMLYTMEVAVEEGLEMAGASIILYGALLLALRRRATAPAPVRAAPVPAPRTVAG